MPKLGLPLSERFIGKTPEDSSAHELIIVDTKITGYKIEEGTEIPRNGFVLSMHHEDIIRQIPQRIVDPSVFYQFIDPQLHNMIEAIQVGPLLVKNEKSNVTSALLSKESFWDWKLYDTNQTRFARMALAVTRDGGLEIVAVAEVDNRRSVLELDSSGATFEEFVRILLKQGYEAAINLDRGESAVLFVHSGVLSPHGDRSKFTDCVLGSSFLPALSQTRHALSLSNDALG